MISSPAAEDLTLASLFYPCQQADSEHRMTNSMSNIPKMISFRSFGCMAATAKCIPMSPGYCKERFQESKYYRGRSINPGNFGSGP